MRASPLSIAAALAGAIAAALAPGAALAGGLFVPDVGTQATGRGGAFVAKADDPSALHHNPAGFARHEGTVILLGMNLIDFSLTFQRAGTYEDPPGADAVNYAGQPFPAVEDQSRPAIGVGEFQALPLIAVSTDFGLRVPGLRFGVGVMVPNSFPERDFGAEYDFERDEANPDLPPPPQRYDVVRQTAAIVMPSVAASYSPMDRLDVGLRASWGIANLEATSHTWGLPNFEEWVSRDGLFEVDASDNFVPSYGVGVLYRPLPAVELGAAYASSMTVAAKGTGVALLGSALGLGDEREEIAPIDEGARCEPGGVPGALKACVTFKLPRTATVGGRFIVRDGAGRERGDVELDVRWEDWSGATDQRVLVDGRGTLVPLDLQESVVRHGFRDVLSVRLGGAYAVPIGDNALVVRAGAAYDTAAAPDSFQRLDLDGAARATLAGGLAFQAARWRIDLAGGAVIEPDRTAPVCNPDSSNRGCPEGSGDAAVADRAQPDPVQPLFDAGGQFQSPFNAGDYSSGYVMLSLGVTVWM